MLLRLVADAISSSLANGFHELQISQGDLHTKSKPELEQIIDMMHSGVFIIDGDTLRQVEAKLDCSKMLSSLILLTSPNELLLSGSSRTEIMGLVSWDTSYSSLVSAIEMVYSGRRYVDRLLESTLSEIATNGATILTNRQMQILIWLQMKS